MEIKSAEVKETLDRALTGANRYDSGFLLVASGASLNATLEKGKALIGGASVGIAADSNESITFAASTSSQGVYVKDDGTVVVSTTDPATGDFIKLWSADTNATGVTATTNLRDTTLQFGSPIRSTRVVIDNAPTANTHGANKEYVDGEVAASGLKPVRAASTAALTLATDVENGDILDGVTLATGDLILLKDQSTGSENGPWLVSATGAPTRPDNFNASADVRGGTVFTVSEGTTNAHRAYILTTDDPITVDSTALTFALHSVEGQRGTASGLATLSGGVHSTAERPTASTSVKGDALVGTATPADVAAVAAVGASTTRWAREDHAHPVPNDLITNAMLANMATQTIKGRTTAGTGDPEDLTKAQAATLIGTSAADASTVPLRTANGVVLSKAHVVAKAAAYTVASGDWGHVHHHSGTYTVTLPAPIAGFQMTHLNASTGVITFSHANLKSKAATLAEQWGGATLWSDGTNWYLVGDLS